MTRLQYLLTRHGFKHTNTIIAQTKYQADLLNENYHRAAIVIPNAHPVPPCYFNKSSKHITILWVANWKPVKQPEIFVKLARKLAGRKNLRFVMLGRNAGYQILVDEAVRNGITVMGEVPNDTVNELFDQWKSLVEDLQFHLPLAYPSDLKIVVHKETMIQHSVVGPQQK